MYIASDAGLTVGYGGCSSESQVDGVHNEPISFVFNIKLYLY